MKRFWHTCLAMIASATMTAGVANAQNDWNVPSEIGSYQSILSRAGYGNGLPATTGRAIGGSGTANAGGMLNGMLNGGMSGGSGSVNGGLLNGGMVNGGGSFNGGMVNNGGMSGGSGSVNGGLLNGGMVNGGGSFNGGMINNGGMVGGSGSVNGGGFANGGGMVTGEVVNGGSIAMPYNGSPASGIGQPMMGSAQPMMTQPRMGTTVMSQPVMSQPVMTQQRMAAPMVSNGGGVVSGGYIDNGYSGGGFVDGGCGGNAYSGVVGGNVGYIDQSFAGGGGNAISQMFSGGRGRGANWVIGAYALSFTRNYEDGVLLSQNAAGDKLFTDDADDGDFGGYGVNLTRRKANGKGLELRYWALNPNSSARLNGPGLITGLPSTEFLEHEPSARPVSSIYNEALFHTVSRETDINNFEVNLLNNGGFYQTRRGRCAHFELFGGFRYFQFDETLTFTAVGDTAVFPLATETVSYQSQVTNDLYGLQLGARNELCFTNKLRGFFSVSSGIFNNNIQTQQNFFDANGVGAVLTDGPSTGREYDYGDEKNEVAIIGELEAGVTYQIGRRARLRAGYRALGISGVGLAADQIPVDFRRTERAQSVNSNGSLLLGGGFLGGEFCF